MRSALLLTTALVVLLSACGATLARDAAEMAQPTPATISASRPDTFLTAWEDDIESGAVGWTHGDDSAQPTRWHVDTYMAYSGNSWWCGTFDYDADGGYGNNWTQYLTSPYVDWTGYTYPVLLYYYRNDTEIGFDFSYAEAESSGNFIPLNRGYDGVIPWTSAGYDLTTKDNPAKVRFAFYSDGGYSDADGYYLSVGGAFAVDDVMIMDYPTTTLFVDDADANVNLVPSVPPAAGDFWSIRTGGCQAYSGTHYWGVTSPDTMTVPPLLQNWLQTPVVDISSYQWVHGCTLYFVYQLFMPADQGGSWQEWGTNDGGATWTRTGWWYGDQCGSGYGACDHFLSSIPISWPGWYGTHQVAGKWIMLTDVVGNTNPDCPYLSAGITIDDTWIEVALNTTPVEDTSWGRIKSLYR